MGRHLRLGVVLRLRELAEETARARLAIELAEHRAAGLHAAGAVARRQDEIVSLTAAQHGGATGAGLAEAAERLAMAEAAVTRRSAELERAAERLLEARLQLAEAARRREIVVRLRDRIEAEERREADRRETERLGDIVSARYVRELLAQADQ
jgi:flagellar export protein FliJ